MLRGSQLWGRFCHYLIPDCSLGSLQDFILGCRVSSREVSSGEGVFSCVCVCVCIGFVAHVSVCFWGDQNARSSYFTTKLIVLFSKLLLVSRASKSCRRRNSVQSPLYTIRHYLHEIACMPRVGTAILRAL